MNELLAVRGVGNKYIDFYYLPTNYVVINILSVSTLLRKLKNDFSISRYSLLLFKWTTF
jgi:hypothetical protein